VTTAAAPRSARTAVRLRSWLSVRHSLRAEAAVVLALYGLYELARGLVVGDTRDALRHARELVALERATGVFVEERVQDTAHALPGLIHLLRPANACADAGEAGCVTPARADLETAEAIVTDRPPYDCGHRRGNRGVGEEPAEEPVTRSRTA
jgi:hypothetical protein